MASHYLQTIDAFRQLKVLVIGELILDSYLRGTTNRLCREAPVPTVSVAAEDHAPGGAANTALNLAALGADVTFLSVTGPDEDARRVVTRLLAQGVNTSHVVADKGRQTLVKKRVVADAQLLVRFDYGTTDAIGERSERQLIKRLESLYPKFAAVVVSDYGYGILTPAVVAALKRLHQDDPRVMVADAKDLRRFGAVGLTAAKPNYAEAAQLLGLPTLTGSTRVEQMLAEGRRLLPLTGARIVAVTVDADGAVVFEKGRKAFRTYTRPVENSRTAGAGDTFVSAFTLALASGVGTAEAAELAQAAAEVAVGKDGTTTCGHRELRDIFSPPRKVIHERDELMERCRRYREQGRRIVFTNGCFDILHTGHINYLREARALGDLLIVGVNTDESVRRLKGAERPINSLADRMAVLAALSSVDHVVVFGEDTPTQLIEQVQPDVFAKGGDYTKATLPEAAVVEALGGEVHILPYMAHYSTTELINKIREAEALESV